MEIVSRKRLRSDDNYWSAQSKIYVDQKFIDLGDPNKMKEVYSKTLNLLFSGSKSCSNNNLKLSKEEIFANVFLNGSGHIKFLKSDTVNDFKESKQSSCCNKSALILSDCANCNLKLCEHCAFSCIGACGSTLCNACVTLFECGTMEEPLCARCKAIY